MGYKHAGGDDADDGDAYDADGAPFACIGLPSDVAYDDVQISKGGGFATAPPLPNKPLYATLQPCWLAPTTRCPPSPMYAQSQQGINEIEK